MLQFYVIISLSLFIATVFLQQYGQKLYIKTYKKHINFLTPKFAPPKSLKQKMLQLFLVFITVSLGIILVLLFTENTTYYFLDSTLYQSYQTFFFGALVGLIISNLAMTIRAILFYKYIERNPSQISGGPLTFDSKATLQIALTGVIEILIPILVIVLVAPHPFVYGLASGMLVLMSAITLKLFTPNLA